MKKVFYPLLFFVFIGLYQNSVAQCDNYLHVAAGQSGAQIGMLDITGDQLTIEAVFKRTEPYSGGYLFAGDLVSKHSNSSDCNYLLRPNGVAIATVNGFRSVDINCEIELNKTYHVAMVYDGSTLKFYRNGVLKGTTAAAGNLITNNLITTIGSCAFFPNNYNEDLRGYINEVRFWNIARTAAELNQYLTTSLPNPPAQTGLLAYYQFDNLLNKQGNAMWNASILGTASINATNPDCTNTLTDNCLALPIKLLSFSAALQNSNNAKLQWTIATAEEESKYELQRSTDGRSFTIINLQTGNAYTTQFNCTDNTLANGKYYYRLKMLDINGKTTYSPIIKIVLGSKGALQVFPNPAKDIITLSGLENKGLIRIISPDGKLVKQLSATAGSMLVDISTLAKGIYILQYNSEEKTTQLKIIKE